MAVITSYSIHYTKLYEVTELLHDRALVFGLQIDDQLLVRLLLLTVHLTSYNFV